MRLADLPRACIVAWLLLVSVAAWSEPSSASAPAVNEAVKKLESDPDLHPVKIVHKVKLKNPREAAHEPESEKPRPELEPRPWLESLASLARILVWALGGAGVLFVLWGIWRWAGVRGLVMPRRQLADLPSHVADLDIRPESLPDRVGSAAWNLWQRGEHRAALSLLYRATLSRLVHVHAVPITEASTEGECVRLARAGLGPSQCQFVEQLVSAWLMTVYGARTPDVDMIHTLCRRFDTDLPAPVSRAGGGPR